MNGTTALETKTPNANTGNNFPWAGQADETACNYAFGLLIRNVNQRLAIGDKTHAPTIMAAAGAIAGVAAQVSLLSDIEMIQKAQEEKKIAEVTLKDGRKFLYGDALNRMLYSVNDPVLASSRAWNMMVSAALSRGLDRSKLPNVPNMFKHVSESFGTDREGFPSVADNAKPALPVRDLLKLVGPVAFAALAGEIDRTLANAAGRANRKSWVAITAQSAANTLLYASRVLPLETCLTIGMESAIYASKMRANAPYEEAKPAQA